MRLHKYPFDTQVCPMSFESCEFAPLSSSSSSLSSPLRHRHYITVTIATVIHNHRYHHPRHHHHPYTTMLMSPNQIGSRIHDGCLVLRMDRQPRSNRPRSSAATVLSQGEFALRLLTKLHCRSSLLSRRRRR